MNEGIAKQLLEPFDPSVIKQLRKGGAVLDYVPVAEVIARMNSVFGYDGWSEESSEVWRDASDPDWIVSHVVLAILVTVDGSLSKITKHGYGGERLKRTKAGEILDLGDAYKGAHSDAFKKAATQLGIGLDLARDEDAVEADRVALEPKATPEQMDLIQATIPTLSGKAAEELKSWWTNAQINSLKSGRLTVHEADLVLEKLESLAVIQETNE